MAISLPKRKGIAPSAFKTAIRCLTRLLPHYTIRSSGHLESHLAAPTSERSHLSHKPLRDITHRRAPLSLREGLPVACPCSRRRPFQTMSLRPVRFPCSQVIRLEPHMADTRSSAPSPTQWSRSHVPCATTRGKDSALRDGTVIFHPPVPSSGALTYAGYTPLHQASDLPEAASCGRWAL